MLGTNAHRSIIHPLSRHHQTDNEDIWKQTSNKTPTLILCVESAGSVLWLCLCMRGEGDILKDSASLSSRRRWDFRARFTATLPGNQACFTQTKSMERAQANTASSCRALLSSRAEIWSATVKCNQGTMCKEPFCQLAKKNLHCRAPGTDPEKKRSWPTP